MTGRQPHDLVFGQYDLGKNLSWPATNCSLTTPVTREYDKDADYVNSGKTLHFVYGGILIEGRETRDTCRVQPVTARQAPAPRR